jgi:hypothetical protein
MAGPTMMIIDAGVVEHGDRSASACEFMPAKLKLAKSFEPCPIDAGDEVFRNGIFEFNVTRLSAFVEAQPERFAIESVAVASVPGYGDSHLDQATVDAADLSRPVLFAEIAPGRFNLIDGNHRMGKARRARVPTVMARKVSCPHHVAFLTSMKAYESYVEYWNGKVKEMQPSRRKVASRPYRAHRPFTYL